MRRALLLVEKTAMPTPTHFRSFGIVVVYCLFHAIAALVKL
ncbi:hypothetical protein [Nostoc sp.]